MTTRTSTAIAVHFADGVVDVMGDPQEPEAPEVYANVRGTDTTSGRPYVALNIGPVTVFTYSPETLDKIEHEVLEAKDKLTAALATQANAG